MGHLNTPLDQRADLDVVISYRGERRQWTTPLFQSVDPLKPVQWPLQAGKTVTINPCFYLPSDFQTIAPNSYVTVQVEVRQAEGGQRTFCIDGTLKVA
ncbi:hypothetical protein BGZ73_001181 [Actinomortierella ambigua]|nr:hypothetical protein BGZ73_001181 [Actinomortierella ambigua]